LRLSLRRGVPLPEYVLDLVHCEPAQIIRDVTPSLNSPSSLSERESIFSSEGIVQNPQNLLYAQLSTQRLPRIELTKPLSLIVVYSCHCRLTPPPGEYTIKDQSSTKLLIP